MYNLETFKSSLHHHLLCSNDLTYGTRIRAKKQAIEHKYIQFNDHYIKFLWLDLDHQKPLIWEDVGLPPPNFIIRNQDNCKSHYVWALVSPIYRDYEHKAKNLSYFAKIQQAFTEKAKADTAFVGLIGKNPLNDYWHVFQPNHQYSYTLDELADHVDLPKQILKRNAIGEGRNCFLFDTVRKWSYKEVLFYKANQATETDFRNVVLARLEKLNIFPNAQPLNLNELKAIAKSISKWTWAKFSNEKFSEIQTSRSHKRIQAKKTKIAREAFHEFS